MDESADTAAGAAERDPTGGPTVAVLGALHAGEAPLALARANAAATGGLLGALRSFLVRGTTPDVYADPEAFDEFIRTGDNPALYAATIEGLREVHVDVRPRTVVDIGCGDGRVTSGCLTPATEQVDLVEPSAPLLDAARRAVAGARSVIGHPCAMQAFMASSSSSQRWDLAQSSFALHTIDPPARSDALRWLSRRVRTIALVEFDVPDLAEGSPEHLAHLAERYEDGVRIYADRPAVVDGFLMPVLVGQLDSAHRTRHTWEQSVDAWCAELARAGFHPSSRRIFDHWWAPAHLIVGHRD